MGVSGTSAIFREAVQLSAYLNWFVVRRVRKAVFVPDGDGTPRTATSQSEADEALLTKVRAVVHANEQG